MDRIFVHIFFVHIRLSSAHTASGDTPSDSSPCTSRRLRLRLRLLPRLDTQFPPHQPHAFKSHNNDFLDDPKIPEITSRNAS